jgi:hypothetical protein
MRASRVVVETPGFDDLAQLSEAAEQVLVEAFVAKASDKALCKPILHRLARKCESGGYRSVRPKQNRGTSAGWGGIAHYTRPLSVSAFIRNRRLRSWRE